MRAPMNDTIPEDIQ